MKSMQPSLPVTESDVHAYVDGRLAPERQREVERWLERRPEDIARVEAYRAQKRCMRQLFDPVLDEAIPVRLRHAAGRTLPWYARRVAAGLALAMLSGAVGWGLHGTAPFARGASAVRSNDPSALAAAAGLARRAAVAHAVYAPDQRRPVEVDAAHEDQLIAWLSKRMGAPMKAPHLQDVGYSLEGGRLLPGGQGPVAQFMYQDGEGGRLTLYVSNEVADVNSGAKNSAAGFGFVDEGSVKVFYWVDGSFGYAISANTDRASLTRVSDEVFRQLGAQPSAK